MIHCQNLVHQYGKSTALDDISLDIGSGEVMGFIGPNGAGKTTTIKILSTLLTPTSGEAFVGGYSTVRQSQEVHSIIGYMPDSIGVYENILVWEYLDFFAAAYLLPRSMRKQTISQVLELTGLTSHYQQPMVQMSKGMLQRLCLAKTLLHDPKILILDEPNSGLDPRARAETKNLLKLLNGMGKTIFISSHILPELADICTSISIIQNGRIITTGKVDDIVALSSHTRQIRVRVLRDAERAASLVQQAPETSQIETNQDTVTFDYSGSTEQLADLSELLISEKLRLIELSERKSDLEDVFLAVTQEQMS